MKRKFLKNIEWGILVCSVILSIIGMIALFSATQNDGTQYLNRQITWFAIGLFVTIIFTIIDYNFILKFAPVYYGALILLLIAVLFTQPINGATSWFDLKIFNLQPGEFGKIFTILFLSYIIVKFQRKSIKEINKFWKLLIVLLIVAVPVILIAMQPDYGTAIAYIFALIFILFSAGINKRYIITAILIIAISLPLLYFFVLPQHAKTRIDVYLDPTIDPRGAGYNIIQSKLAIGAGQLLGMGFLTGNQTQLGFLYPKTTDFIYSVIGEEFGFVLAGTVIILYVILITKAVYIAKTAKDDTGSYIAIGIAGILFFHMVENIGMTMGLLPITGIPLLFVSYGGSSLITSFIYIGLLLNISGRRQKAIFIGE